MSVCADCGRPILPNEGYVVASPGTPPESYHTGCGDPFGTKARDAEINRLRARAANAEDTVLGQFRELERLRAALAEAERERDGALRKLDDYLLDYKAFHGICTMRDLRARAERAEADLSDKSTQIAELQEQLHHLYGVEQRAERA